MTLLGSDPRGAQREISHLNFATERAWMLGPMNSISLMFQLHGISHRSWGNKSCTIRTIHCCGWEILFPWAVCGPSNSETNRSSLEMTRQPIVDVVAQNEQFPGRQYDHYRALIHKYTCHHMRALQVLHVSQRSLRYFMMMLILMKRHKRLVNEHERR